MFKIFSIDIRHAVIYFVVRLTNNNIDKYVSNLYSGKINIINETQYLHIINKLFKRCTGHQMFCT